MSASLNWIAWQLVDRLAERDALLARSRRRSRSRPGRCRPPARRRRGACARACRARRDRPLPDLADDVLGRARARPRTTGEPVGEPLMPSLCSSLRDREARAVLLDDERGDAAVLAVGRSRRRRRSRRSPAFVIQFFVPLMTHSSPSRTARRAHRRRGRSRPRARTARTPATTRRSRSAAGSAASARRCRTAGSAACRAPGP